MSPRQSVPPRVNESVLGGGWQRSVRGAQTLSKCVPIYHHLLPNFVPRDRCCHRTFLGLLLTQIHRMLCPFCSSQGPPLRSNQVGQRDTRGQFVSVTSGMDNVGPFLGTMCVGKNACQSGASRRRHPNALPLLYRTPRGAETDS
jgi:hypothetical protein